MYAKEISWIVVWLVFIAVALVSFLMNFWVPYFFFVAVVSGISSVFFTVPAIWWGLAPMNICFTFIHEGTAKIVVSGGEAVKTLIQFKGHKINSKGRVVKGEQGERLFGGLAFYGIWPLRDIYIYNFSWTAVTERGEIKEHRNETLDYIGLFDDVYWLQVVKAEDDELVPLDVEALVVIRIVNPYKALFRVQDWLEMVLNRVKPLLRKEISDFSYEALIQDRESLGKKIYDKAKDLWSELEKDYGVKVLKLEVKEIDPPDDLRKLTLKKVTAQREAEVVKIQADAEKGRIATVFGALEETGETGKLVRTLEALEKSPEKGSKWVVPLSGGVDALIKAFTKT